MNLYGYEQINLKDLLITFSKALDFIDYHIANHHLRVTVIADEIATELGLPQEEKQQLVIAAMLHDIGVFTLADKLRLVEYELTNPYEHAERGYLLIKDFEIFRNIADIIRYHHIRWNYGNGQYADGKEVPIGSHILHLADRIEILIKREKEVLMQKDKILSSIQNSGEKFFNPKVLKAFYSVSRRECFWFEATHLNIEQVILDREALPIKILSLNELYELTKFISHIIDYRSRFTAVHSAGVSAVAGLLAQLSGFSAIECQLIRVAGFLHDIGKLAIPVEIIEKPSKLTEPEYNVMKSHVYHSYRIIKGIKGLEGINTWASFHHERMNGDGYPFHLKGNTLPIGAKIMAVADVFTAVSEDRPYRKGMDMDKALLTVESMVQSGNLDGDIVLTTKNYFDHLNDIRIYTQEKTLREYLTTKYVDEIKQND
ncbi:MAG: HD domain-containing protein [Candidatus Magnetoovum sp. WYHC-5]|nr:HD domain-containing protein [Candidatus Magnetoovum sp. WYHC-5]